MSDSTGNQDASFLDTAKSAVGILGGHAQLANGAAQVSGSLGDVCESDIVADQ